MKDHIKGSLRSRKGFDVFLIAKELGGAGHKEASGFILKKMPVSEAKKKVLDVIDKKWKDLILKRDAMNY